MTTWTKADLRRMQDGLDLSQRRVAAKLTVASNDTHRERVNARLSDDALDLVRDYLRRLVAEGVGAEVTGVSTLGQRIYDARIREARAASRLLERLEVEPLPRELLTIPQVRLQRLSDAEQVQVERLVALGMPDSAGVVVLNATERREREAAEQRIAELAKPVDVPLYQVDLERDLASIACNLADVVTSDRIEVHGADSDAFNTDTPWGDIDGRVSWWTWARPVAERRAAERGFDRCIQNGASAWLPSDALALRSIWAFACAEETLPKVLDLRGVPEHHGVLLETWRDALVAALQRSARGVVLIVEREAWALARLLPDRVGRSS